MIIAFCWRHLHWLREDPRDPGFLYEFEHPFPHRGTVAWCSRHGPLEKMVLKYIEEDDLSWARICKGAYYDYLCLPFGEATASVR